MWRGEKGSLEVKRVGGLGREGVCGLKDMSMAVERVGQRCWRGKGKECLGREGMCGLKDVRIAFERVGQRC